MTKLIVLGIENSIVLGYHSDKYDEQGRLQLIIDEALPNVLSALKNKDFHMVIITDNSANYAYYYDAFSGFNILNDSKLRLYSQEVIIEERLRDLVARTQLKLQDLYYYDGNGSNVQRALKAGFKNSYQVTIERPLLDQLEQLNLSSKNFLGQKEKKIKNRSKKQSINFDLEEISDDDNIENGAIDQTKPFVSAINEPALNNNTMNYTLAINLLFGVTLVGGCALLVTAFMSLNLMLGIVSTFLIGGGIVAYGLFAKNHSFSQSHDIAKITPNFSSL